MKQTALILPLTPSYARADFVVSECNYHALSMLENWPDWPSYGLVLIGAPASGKTHLARLWQQRAGAKNIHPAHDDIAAYSGQHILIDDADASQNDEAQTVLFHLLNLAKEQQKSILLTATTPPSGWEITLPDLKSRLNSLPQIALDAPDDALLKAVLTKHFADRQVAVDASVVDYIVTRCERSFASLQSAANALDALALGSKRPITIPLVREWFEKH